MITRTRAATMRIPAVSRRALMQVLLAIDGSGPMAKMATQQSRRRKTATKRAFADARGLSPLLLTPGTQFMERLEQALVYWICSELGTARGRRLRKPHRARTPTLTLP